ncbi:MAG: hypothetical protein EXX96DRAFT_619200 [Benjaminiella poitrasii]|nr:MAG: hypothetical protein EXX96DRAFT_619200 [Benjaminiella poitrasii]
MTVIIDDEKKETNPPNRYYTPQAKNPTIQTSIFEPTPTPESVTFHTKPRPSKKESCCLACLLACFLCFAVKEEDVKAPEQTP